MEVNHFITIYNISETHKNKHKKAKKYQDILFVFLVSMSVKVDLYIKFVHVQACPSSPATRACRCRCTG